MTAGCYAKNSCRAKNSYYAKLKRVKLVTSHVVLLPIALSLCLLSNQASARTPSPLCDTLATYDEKTGRANHNEESSWKDVEAQTIISACKQAVSFYPDDIRYVYQLAKAYDDDEDYAQAVIYYSQAAKQGYAPAQQNLGNLYRMGRGVAQSDQEAFEWFLKAAEQGNIHAQSDLGGMYYLGRGVEQSDEKAFDWTLKAAEQGDSYAQFNIGLIYEMGRGVERSVDKAMAWYQKAADQGSYEAQVNLSRLQRML